jgi:protein gp37
MDIETRPNIWLGISVENQTAADKRIPMLAGIEANHRWLSIEPMLEDIDLTRHYLYITKEWHAPFGWVVYGGESGPNCRPCDPAWIRLGIEQCRIARVSVFIKQLGGWPDSRHELSDFPEDLRIREFPHV